MTQKATMSLDRFMEYLEKTTALYEWKMNNGGFLRAYPMVKATWSLMKPLCPITAVYASLFDEYINLGDYTLAGKKLGLSAATMTTIVCAADGGYHDLMQHRVRKASKAKRVRERMEAVLHPQVVSQRLKGPITPD